MSLAPFGINYSQPNVWGDANAMFTLSQNLVNQTEEFVAELEGIKFTAPVVQPNFPVLAAAPAPLTAAEPDLIDVTWQVPAEPAPFEGSLNVQGVLPGPFTGQAPSLVFPTAPTPFSTPPPQSPAIDLNFTYPTIDITLPTPPTLLTLDTIQFSPLNIPTFNVSVPTLTAVAPNIQRYIEGATFTSTLLTSLENDLNDAITNGTNIGLPGPVETALWDRAREREYRQQADALVDLERMEAMGFAFPPGVYTDARIKIATETSNAIAGLSREIMIKQAETMLANIIKAREDATQLEGKLIDYANNIAQRAFESARYVTEASVAIYNAQIKSYEASLEGYRTMAMVYDTQIKGIQAQVELLNAEIRFEQTKAQINTALIAQYESQVRAASLIVEIYKTEVQTIQIEAEIEKIKIDAFAAQIQAFVGQINAYTATVEAYKATVETQVVIENAYKISVDAYAAEVNAGVAEANALIAQFDGQVRAYQAQLDGYKAAIQGMVGQAQAASLYNTAEADVYRSATNAISSYNGTVTAQWQAVINEQTQIAQIGVAAAEANGKLYIAAEGLVVEAARAGAQVMAQLGSAALGAIHWATTSSWSSSLSQSVANSYQATNEDITQETA